MAVVADEADVIESVESFVRTEGAGVVLAEEAEGTRVEDLLNHLVVVRDVLAPFDPFIDVELLFFSLQLARLALKPARLVTLDEAEGGERGEATEGVAAGDVDMGVRSSGRSPSLERRLRIAAARSCAPLSFVALDTASFTSFPLLTLGVASPTKSSSAGPSVEGSTSFFLSNGESSSSAEAVDLSARRKAP